MDIHIHSSIGEGLRYTKCEVMYHYSNSTPGRSAPNNATVYSSECRRWVFDTSEFVTQVSDVTFLTQVVGVKFVTHVGDITFVTHVGDVTFLTQVVGVKFVTHVGDITFVTQVVTSRL